MGRIWLAQPHKDLKGGSHHGLGPDLWRRRPGRARWPWTWSAHTHARKVAQGVDLGRRGRPVLAKQGAMRSTGRARRSSHASEQEQGKQAPDEHASARCRGSGGGRLGRGQATAELGATAATGSRWKESDVRDSYIRRSPGDGDEPSRPSSGHCASFGSLPRTRQGESLRVGKRK